MRPIQPRPVKMFNMEDRETLAPCNKDGRFLRKTFQLIRFAMSHNADGKARSFVLTNAKPTPLITFHSNSR